MLGVGRAVGGALRSRPILKLEQNAAAAQFCPHGFDKNAYQQPSRKKFNLCFTPVCGMTITKPIIYSQELCRLKAFLLEHYFPYEPLFVANEVPVSENLLQFFINSASQGNILYGSLEGSKEPLGMVFGRVVTAKMLNEAMEYINRVKEPNTKAYLEWFVQLNTKVNLFMQREVKKILEIDVLVVRKDLRRRDVGTSLLMAIAKYAEENAIPLVRFNSTSKFGHMTAKKACYKLDWIGMPNIFKDVSNEQLMPAYLCPPHREVHVYSSDTRKIKPPMEKSKKDPCKVVLKYQ